MCCGGKSLPIKTQVVTKDKPKATVITHRISPQSEVTKLTIKRQSVELPSTCPSCGFPMMTVTNHGVSYRKCSNANCRFKQ